MEMQKKYFYYDLFKLMVLSILLVILAVLYNAYIPVLKPEEVIAKPLQPTEPNVTTDGEVSIDKIPMIPTTNQRLVINAGGNGLLNANGELVFVLSDDHMIWKPTIPSDLIDKLPSGFLQERDESGIWQLTSEVGEALLVFNQEELSWQMIERNIEDEQNAQEYNEMDIACPDANPARIRETDNFVQVVNAQIPLRSSPQPISENFIMQLQQGTILEVLGEPVCTPYLAGANLWWPVRLKNGQDGFAAEGSAISDLYYLEPIN